jgi:hypothetical protein
LIYQKNIFNFVVSNEKSVVASTAAQNHICYQFFLIKKNVLEMLTVEEMATMSIEELAKHIDAHHAQGSLLYTAMAGKVVRINPTGDGSMRDEALNVATYWFGEANDNKGILPANFDYKGFGSALTSLTSIIGATSQDVKNTALLKTARNHAAKDCATFSSAVRKRFKELEKDPVYKLVLDKEPQPITPPPSAEAMARKQKAAKKAAKQAAKS